MKAAKDIFETWYEANYDHKPGEDDIKELFREAFEAGMVSGLAFMQTHADKLMDDYKGFQDAN